MNARKNYSALVTLTLVFGGFCTASAAPLGSPHSAAVLDGIVKQVRESYSRQESPVVVFDLDGTLLDNRPRILNILREYGENELKDVRPEAKEKIDAIAIDDIRYMLTDTLRGAGIEEPAILNNGAVYWAQRFFTDAYLHHDAPNVGAVDFVRTLYSSGARIVYLTGRDAPRQLLGTVKSLRDHGFPIGIQGSELIMKPTVQTQDAMFKQKLTRYLRGFGTVIAAFDSETANINVYRRAFGKATCVLFKTNASPNPPPLLPKIHAIHSF